uniref:Uncharacterized protein n=1 Tax=Cannabis sativa TaxID=3483 RepID=A0A803Q5Q9_CANSA
MKVGLVEWDEEVVTDVLNDRDQSLVWKIPLSSSSTSDMWYWLKDESGMFTIKSAYAMLQSLKTSSILPDNSGFWHQLWQLKLPPKVLNFLWRASSNSLPTRFQLSSRHVPIDSTCPFCRAAPETTLHVLMRCQFAQSCWNIINVPMVAPGAMLFSSCVTTALVDGLNVQSGDHWTTPDLPYVKVNVDGTLFTTQGRYGVGFAARTTACLVLAARVISKSGSLQPHVVEAIGIKEALSWSKANRWPKVVIGSDYIRVINDLQKFKHMVSPYGHILYDCKNLIAGFVDVSFNFVKRSANEVAHALARSSLCEADRTFSGDTLASIIASLVLDDLS